MNSVTASRHPEVALAELRASIGDIINRAAYAGERVVVTRNGKPAAALISAEELAYFEELENAADAAALDAARATDDDARISIEEHAGAHDIGL
ncbi:type II toxin-antitoxin system prevent-host-death family antitoxin [Mycobacterium sp. M1]|uniref:Antitoxin n=1 Tax=Mycolicibacter acidiphilus TaxID=2835306 RepID=A0ABS5RK10_9MYCO|nr:type II toxin-antitoxin system prevent-host-death family antitoxin [Mycolicibacter acidiphilus]MBS9534581.1 type II toxin-antitoxin system prevent-host-death family antitoxin [Mycolicibacter acidiphilus]